MHINNDILFIRHGKSTKNEAAQQLIRRTGFKDWTNPVIIKNIVHNPFYMDAHLSPTGIKECQSARERLKDYHPDVILCSPLQRALESCHILFEGREIPRIVKPLLSETFKHTSQICRSVTVKKKEFPDFDFSRVDAEGEFWFIKNDSYENQKRYFDFLNEFQHDAYAEKAKRISEFMMETKIREQSENVRERARKLKVILRALKQKYSNICVVTHFYTIRFLVCKEFDQQNEPIEQLQIPNCSSMQVSLEEICKYE